MGSQGTSGALVRLSLQLEPEVIERLDRLAALRQTSRAAIAREALEPGLSEMESEQLKKLAERRSA